MKYLILGLLTLGIAVAITVLVVQTDPGYVMLNYAGWSMETSFNIFALLSVLGFITLYFTVRLLLGTWHLPSRMSFWSHSRRAVRARKLTNQGLIALAEANWVRAEKLLSQSAAHSDTPLINYLGAAQAAQKLGFDLRRDDYLTQAYHSMPDAELAVGLTQAEVQISHGQTEQALATLQHLQTISPKHAQVLYLLKKLYEKLQGWDELYGLLGELRKNHVLNEKAMTSLEYQVHHNRLHDSKTLEQLESNWQQVSKSLRQSPQLLHEYATCLKQLGDEEKADGVVNDYLKKQFDPAVMRLFGQLRGSDSNRQMATAEQWLQEHGHHPELLLALGRIALRNQLWGKARSYLEASLGIKPMAVTCCELGNLLQQLGEKERAADYFRQGLLIASGGQCTNITITAAQRAISDEISEAPRASLQEPIDAESEAEAPVTVKEE
jgi:HemY protein